jgi:hypothetical protein
MIALKVLSFQQCREFCASVLANVPDFSIHVLKIPHDGQIEGVVVLFAARSQSKY